MKQIIIISILLLFLLTSCSFLIDEEVNEAAKDAIKANDPEKCKQIEDESQSKELSREEQCYAKVAEGLKDWKICELIDTSSRMFYCYEDVAVALEDPEICKKIDRDNYKDDCFADVALEAKYEYYCEEISDVDKKRNCIVDVAVKKEDAATCVDSFLPAENVQICLNRVAIAQDSYKPCFEDDFGYYVTECITKYALHKEDPSLCNKLDDDNQKHNPKYCYWNLAAKLNQPELCDKMFDVVNEDPEGAYIHCISATAVANKNVTLCDEIVHENEYFKIDCVRDAS